MLAVLLWLALVGPPADGHIVPPEKLHPVAESYRRLTFLLRLNPVLWAEVKRETRVIADGLAVVAADEAEAYRAAAEGPADRDSRLAAAAELFHRSTAAVARILQLRLERARDVLMDHPRASRELEEARQIWAAFEHEVAATDRDGFRRLGECWLELASALGNPGVLGIGAVAPDTETFAEESEELIDYLTTNFSDRATMPQRVRLEPVPSHSPTFDPRAAVPPRLPPGAEINKQLPRPRQILNMAARGVDESETNLIALGDMAFDSPFIFGDPARSLAISCNTCHNKSITNPNLFIPGLSARPGGLDVSNSFFAPHANNGHFDPVDIPDLRGIRYTAPYGRNGRFDSLREFVRNVIVNEFNGPEPEPLMLDGLIAYMLEFDFLSNPALAPEGRLSDSAPLAARRGEEIFHRRFPQMGDRACSSCHVPSDHFLDRRRHDIGSYQGAGPDSRDRALDTPTLLGIRYTAPYFHDGSLPTLRAVSEWFDRRFGLGLSEAELADLTAYLETVGDGVEPYEDTVHTLEAELEEFSFFLSAYEFLVERGRTELIDTTLQTIALEIRAHKWDVRDPARLPTLDRLAKLMDEAHAASRRGNLEEVALKVTEYRELYRQNAGALR